VRLKFKDSDVIEGILPNDLTQNPAEGFLLNPPDLRSNTQRLFVPRDALTSVTVLAVIGSANRAEKAASRIQGRSRCSNSEAGIRCQVSGVRKSSYGISQCALLLFFLRPDA